jgi:hypothetical protein
MITTDLKKHKSVLILKALLDGTQIESKETGHTFVIVKDEKDRNRFCCTAQKVQGSAVEEVFLPVEFTIDAFLDFCENISDEQIVQICANAVLKKINQKDRS